MNETEFVPEIEYLKGILRGLVSSPITIVKSLDEMGILLTIKAIKPDMGKIIGRQGGTINAIRHIMRCYGLNLEHKSTISVRIDEPSFKNDNPF